MGPGSPPPPVPVLPQDPRGASRGLRRLTAARPSPQLKARCEELKLDWSTLSLEGLLKEKQALKSQISEKQRHCLELQVGSLSEAGGGFGLQLGRQDQRPRPSSRRTARACEHLVSEATAGGPRLHRESSSY